jgi:tripeptide aminopeptidase
MRRPAIVVLLVLGVAAIARPAGAQPAADVAALLTMPSVRAAIEQARSQETETLAFQRRICEVPAPPFGETARAAVYAQAFREAGLDNVRVDDEGNVLGVRPGRTARPHLVLSAHLDTVFPEGTDVRVTRAGEVFRGPGIADDCRGLAVVLTVARVLDAARIETEGPITFVGTVGEEGLGDLRGVRALLTETLPGRVDRFVSIDGAGLGMLGTAVGSRRYRVTFTGPGGHSFSSFGIPNPIHAVGRLVAAVADFEVPDAPRATFNVGRVGGGTSVNAISAEAWVEVDLRSSDPAALRAIDARFQRAIDRALADERARWAGGVLEVAVEVVGDRPAGSTAADSPLARTAVAVSRALGVDARLDAGSTDANLPMSLGVPAITIGGGGRGSGTHSLAEVFDSRDSWLGTQRAVLLAIALSQ